MSVAPETVAGLDEAVDRAFDRVRGKPWADTTAVVVSNLADYGFVWSVVAATKGRRRSPARRRALRALTISGVASAGVNTLVKNAVGRQRPASEEAAAPASGLPVRTPSTSSFPSGHTLAAFCTAMVLSDSKAERVAYTAFAAAVGASRVHLRAHHASDVLGAAAIGTALGLVARRLIPR